MSELRNLETLPPSSTTNKDTVNEHVSSGYSLYWKGEYDKARISFTKLINDSSTNDKDAAQCYNALGAIDTELGNYDEAIVNYQSELKLLKNSNAGYQAIVKSYIAIGTIYWRKYEYDQALFYHQKALDLPFDTTSRQTDAQISSIYQRIANIYTDKNEYSLAREYFDKALKIDEELLRDNHPKLGKTYANMGAMYNKKHDYEQALNYFTKA
ncbi:unnamed protein product, partial [Rotaria sp. Silwood1]